MVRRARTLRGRSLTFFFTTFHLHVVGILHGPGAHSGCTAGLAVITTGILSTPGGALRPPTAHQVEAGPAAAVQTRRRLRHSTPGPGLPGASARRLAASPAGGAARRGRGGWPGTGTPGGCGEQWRPPRLRLAAPYPHTSLLAVGVRVILLSLSLLWPCVRACTLACALTLNMYLHQPLAAKKGVMLLRLLWNWPCVHACVLAAPELRIHFIGRESCDTFGLLPSDLQSC